ncbi:MAG: hypothetical protein PVJ09_05295 [Candidatus Woesebacteria bacterium]|jgi:hypothetical protein
MADVKAYSYTNSKGVTYYLHTREVTLKNGRVQRIYFFARDIRDGALEEVPAGYMVVETKRTGMPVLKKTEKKAKAK